MHDDNTPSPSPESIPSTSKRYHPINLCHLPDDDPLDESFVELLWRLDGDLQTISEMEIQAIGDTLQRASEMDQWGSDTAEKIMKWVYYKYRHITAESVHQFFPRMELSNHQEIREGLIAEAEESYRKKIVLLLKSMPYDKYLSSSHWQHVRKQTLRRAGYRCQICNANAPLHVHHRTYERRGEEEPGDVIALCAECHQHFHKKLEVR